GHLHPRDDLLGVRRCLIDLRPTQHVLQLTDARLLLPLLLAGGVVATVLAEVALLTGSSDPRGDLRATLGRQVLQFGLELLVSVLGQPDRLGGVFSHRDSLGYLGNFGGKFPTGADRPQWRSDRWRPTGTVWVCRPRPRTPMRARGLPAAPRHRDCRVGSVSWWSPCWPRSVWPGPCGPGWTWRPRRCRAGWTPTRWSRTPR